VAVEAAVVAIAEIVAAEAVVAGGVTGIKENNPKGI
jgi:hypothetical protein